MKKVYKNVLKISRIHLLNLSSSNATCFYAKNKLPSFRHLNAAFFNKDEEEWP